MKRKFGIKIPCVQYRYRDEPNRPCLNPFENYRLNSSIVRVTDMFCIKDKNAWVWNAILTQSAPERVYAYGTQIEARKSLLKLNTNQLKNVVKMFTYEEDGLFVVKRSGKSVSANNTPSLSPILQKDQSAFKQYHQNLWNEKTREIQCLEERITQLDRFVRDAQRTLDERIAQFKQKDELIKKYEKKIKAWQREKTELEEDEEDDDGLQQQMRDLQNSIEDEQAGIESLEDDIRPHKEKEMALLQEIAKKKHELQRIEEQCKEDEQAGIESLEDDIRPHKEKEMALLQEIAKKKHELQRIEEQCKEDEQAGI
eukprot:984352_1